MAKLRTYKKVVDNKLRGNLGETTTSGKKKERVIKINKKAHKKAGKGVRKNPNGSANLKDTILHETLHALHPEWSEKKTYSETKKRYSKLTQAHSKRLYAMFNKPH